MNKENWTIMVIGDRFLKNELFHGAIDRELADLPVTVHYKFLENAWPDEAFQDIEEVHEAIGDVDEIIKEVADVDIIVTDMAPVTKRIIDAAPNLKLIGVTRGGPINANTAYAAEKGIPVVNTPGRNATAVAEFTIGMIFAHVKKIAECHADMKKGIWRGDCYRYEMAPLELSGQTVGLVGFGIIARLVAPMLKSLGMKVIAFDPYVSPDVFKKLGVLRVDLETLLNTSDVVSLHARVTPETTGQIGEKELGMMKSSAFIVNSGRGPLMDYGALYHALKERRIAGAVLDTFDVEPLDPDSPLLKLENLTLTPHIAGSSKETAAKSCERMAKEIRRLILGEPLECCITDKRKVDSRAAKKEDFSEKAQELLVLGHNCAQTTLKCCQQLLGNQNDDVLRSATGFGGGIGNSGDLCGAVAGGVMAIGQEFGRVEISKEEAARKEHTYELAAEYRRRFIEARGSVYCRDLLGLDISDKATRKAYWTDENRRKCAKGPVATGLRILNQMFDREGVLAKE